MIQEKIVRLKERNEFLLQELSKPDVASDSNKFRKIAREQSEISDVLIVSDKLENITTQLESRKNEFIEKSLHNTTRRILLNNLASFSIKFVKDLEEITKLHVKVEVDKFLRNLENELE